MREKIGNAFTRTFSTAASIVKFKSAEDASPAIRRDLPFGAAGKTTSASCSRLEGAAVGHTESSGGSPQLPAVELRYDVLEPKNLFLEESAAWTAIGESIRSGPSLSSITENPRCRTTSDAPAVSGVSPSPAASDRCRSPMASSVRASRRWGASTSPSSASIPPSIGRSG